MTTLLLNAVRGASTDFAAEAIAGLDGACGRGDSARDTAGLIAGVRRTFAGDVKLLVAIGGFYEQSGMLAEAESTFTQALALRPGDSQIMHRLTHLGRIVNGRNRGN